MHLNQKFKKLLHILAVGSYRNALWASGSAAAVEHSAFLRQQRFDVILDVGANRGQFSLVARHIQPDAKIYAFEPLPTPALTYQSIFEHDNMVKLFDVAVMPAQDKRVMNISRRDDSSSLLPITATQTMQFPGTEAVSQIEVQCAPLSQLLHSEVIAGRILLKIDVQGAELEVLKSAQSLLSSVSIIYVELSLVQFYGGQPLAAEVIQFLAEQGFHIDGIFNATVDYKFQKLLQADFSFIRR